MGSGAITRSSISFVWLNSCTSGTETAWMPWKMIEEPIRPGTRMSPNDRWPWPIFGST